LRQRPAGFEFRRQHLAGSYVLDFFCNEAKLAVEVDGISHNMGDRPFRDATRDRWLNAQGIEVMRIAPHDVTTNADSAIGEIVAACRERGNPLHQPSAGPPSRAGEETF
jgi:very-short-patch-repair endonuclease